MKTLNIFGKFQKSEKIKKLKINLKKKYKFNNITSAMFNAYLISTLKFKFEKNDKINNITSAM